MVINAEEGAISTKDMIATKGKSRYFGDRSIGYQDTDATSIYLIIKAIYEAL